MGEGGRGGILRIDFSSDGKRVRAETLGAGATSSADSTTIATILFSAESGELCEDQNVSGVVRSSSRYLSLICLPSANVQQNERHPLAYMVTRSCRPVGSAI